MSLSLGSIDPLDEEYLARLRELTSRFEPIWVSDHLCWTKVDGENLHDLLPLPFTEEALTHIVGRINEVQDVLGRRILIENVSSYVTYQESEIPEWEFLSEVARRTDCGILLDINNVFVSSVNHDFEPLDYLNGLPKECVAQFHLAGYTDNGNHLIDTHDHPVSQSVWELYRKGLTRFGPVSTLVERDANIPGFSVLMEELQTARMIQEETIGKIEKQSQPPWRASAADARLHT